MLQRLARTPLLRTCTATRWAAIHLQDARMLASLLVSLGGMHAAAHMLQRVARTLQLHTCTATRWAAMNS